MKRDARKEVLYINTKIKLDSAVFSEIKKRKEIDGIPITTSIKKAIDAFFRKS